MGRWLIDVSAPMKVFGGSVGLVAREHVPPVLVDPGHEAGTIREVVAQHDLAARVLWTPVARPGGQLLTSSSSGSVSRSSAARDRRKKAASSTLPLLRRVTGAGRV